MRSIRSHLLVVLLALFGVSWGVFSGLTYLSTRQEAQELFDANLAQTARVLLALLEHEIQESGFDTLGTVVRDHAGADYEDKVAFQVWVGGKLLLRSDRAPATIIAPEAGFSDRELQGQSWRVFRLDDPAYALSVLTLERLDVRNELLSRILRQALWPMALILPILSGLIWIGVGHGIMPLRRLARDVAQRSPSALDPVPASGAPSEVRPLTEAINRLLERLGEALDGERRFTANASHELRTPLAGIKAQAQRALQADDGAERTQALRRIVDGVDRAARLVEQLLTLERLDPAMAGNAFRTVDLAEIAAEAVARLAPAAHAKRIDIGLVVAPGASVAAVSGLPDALGVLLANLVDNAIRYTPTGGRVELTVTLRGGEVECAITDTGPGIPHEQREQVFGRFYRIPGSAAPGSGLGLSIARRIAEIHRATIGLAENAGGGLRVTVRFPAAARE